MRRAVLTATLLSLPAALLHAHPHDDAPADNPALRAEVMRLREAVREAAAARDIARLQTLYAADFTHTHGSGRVDGRDARIVALASGNHPTIELAPVEDLLVRTFGNHTAIASGQSPIPVAAENRTHMFRWIAVYVRIDGSLRLAASQATRIAAPA